MILLKKGNATEEPLTDFRIFQCEECGSVEMIDMDCVGGFNKEYLIPNLRCSDCGESTRSLLLEELEIK